VYQPIQNGICQGWITGVFPASLHSLPALDVVLSEAVML
jgi:hypothetical protein